PASPLAIKPLAAEIKHFPFNRKNEIRRPLVFLFLNFNRINHLHVMQRRFATGKVFTDLPRPMCSSSPTPPPKVKPHRERQGRNKPPHKIRENPLPRRKRGMNGSY